jgi:hypothetical protein
MKEWYLIQILYMIIINDMKSGLLININIIIYKVLIDNNNNNNVYIIKFKIYFKL